MNRSLVSIVFISLFMFIMSCANDNENSTGDSGDSNSADSQIKDNIDEQYVLNFKDFISANRSTHEEDGDYTYDSNTATAINLSELSISSFRGVSITNNTATISEAGTYILSGTLNNGRIIVNTSDKDAVKIVLNGANITCSDQSPLVATSAEKMIVFLADGTENSLTDGSTYTFAEGTDEPNATLFCKGNLSIAGSGSLSINSNYNIGISSKDGLIINSGNITINSVGEGIRGKDYLVINGGTFNIISENDALKSNDSNADRGYIYITDGNFTINSQKDGVQAESDLIIEGGTFDITCADGHNSTTFVDTESAKGLKGTASVLIDGANITLSCADDGIKSDTLVCINGGTINISSGSDGIQSELNQYINGGEINISTCVEGLEAVYLVINTGNITIVSSDDALNTANGGDEEDDGSKMIINGGYTACYPQSGDGLDSNGTLEINGGTVLVHAPSSGVEIGVDVNGAIRFNYGLIVIAEHLSNMRETPSSASAQNSVLVGFSSTQSARTIFNIQNSDGESIITFKPKNSYSSVTFSSPLLEKGNTYTIYTGGSSNGTEKEGLYTDGIYSGGYSYASFTVTNTVSTVGNTAGGGGGRL
ncbi:MAG: carbohydrate-binding domain-containing protein [Mangrovibacterium sp.]